MNHTILSFLAALAAYALTTVGPSVADDAQGDDLVAEGVYNLPSKTRARAVAVVYSGDGGWQDLDRTIGEWLTGQSVHVLGVSTLKAFWESHEPPEVAATFERMIATADPSGTLPILVVGYSFGADIVPFAWPQIRPELRDRIKLVALLAPERQTEFHVSVEGWLGIETGSHSVTEAIAALPPDKVLCAYGDEESDATPCAPATLPGMTVVRTAGGHHFDGDYVGLGRRILAAFDRNVGAAGSAVAQTAPPAAAMGVPADAPK